MSQTSCRKWQNLGPTLVMTLALFSQGVWLSCHILYNNIASLYLGVVKFEFSQQPEVVEVGGEVKVVCKATAAKENKLHYFSWTDGGGVDILTTSTNQEGEYVLTVNETELDESKVVYCTVSVEVKNKQKQENGSYTVHVAGESYMVHIAWN